MLEISVASVDGDGLSSVSKDINFIVIFIIILLILLPLVL